MMRIAIADQNVKFIELTKEKLKGVKKLQVMARVNQPDQVEIALEQHPVSVVLYGPSWAKRSSLALMSEISLRFPNVSSVLLADSLSTELLREALHAGVKDVLPRSVEPDELAEAISRADQVARQMRQALRVGSSGQADETEVAPGARVITLLGTKGGTGKSFIATNLAVSLVKETKKKVAVLDLDLQFGDVSVILQLFPKRTIYDLVDDIERLDSDMMKGFLTMHDSGVSVLASPLDPGLADGISPAHIRKVVEVLKTMTDYLVVDTPAQVDEKVLAAVDESDEVFVIASMDLPSVKDAKLALQVLQMDGLKPNTRHIHLIVNRSDSHVGLQPDHLVQTLKTKIYASIPSSRQVPLSMNKGTPLVQQFPRSPVARSLHQLTSLVVQESNAGRRARKERS